MVYNINWFMNRFKSDTRCWLLTLGVLIAIGMFVYAVSTPIVSIHSETSSASPIQLKITRPLAVHFKIAQKINTWFN